MLTVKDIREIARDKIRTWDDWGICLECHAESTRIGVNNANGEECAYCGEETLVGARFLTDYEGD